MKTYIAKSLGHGTARNWRSVCNVKAIAEQIGRESSKPDVKTGARCRRGHRR